MSAARKQAETVAAAILRLLRIDPGEAGDYEPTFASDSVAGLGVGSAKISIRHV
jgi:hypothetical protein